MWKTVYKKFEFCKKAFFHKFYLVHSWILGLRRSLEGFACRCVYHRAHLGLALIQYIHDLLLFKSIISGIQLCSKRNNRKRKQWYWKLNITNYTDDTTRGSCELNSVVRKLEADSEYVLKWFRNNYQKANNSNFTIKTPETT